MDGGKIINFGCSRVGDIPSVFLLNVFMPVASS